MGPALDSLNKNSIFSVKEDIPPIDDNGDDAIKPFVSIDDEKGDSVSKSNIDEGEKKNDDLPDSENLGKMPFIKAVVLGYLTRSEYMALGSWFGGLFLVFTTDIIYLFVDLLIIFPELNRKNEQLSYHFCYFILYYFFYHNFLQPFI
jgi:hypothetical protein